MMEGVSYAGHPVISGTAPLLLFHAGEYETAKHSYLGLFFNCASVIPMKFLVNRQRPCGVQIRQDASFPSGHTTFLFTQAYIISHHYPRTTVPVFAFAGVVGLSRIYLQKHYPSDVIAGVALGLLTGFVVTTVVD
jgi:undecaprenyl-diphosphatase